MAFGSIDKCAVLAWDPNYSESSLVACGSIDQQQSTENGCNHSLELYSLAGGVQARGGEKVPSSFSKLLWAKAERASFIVGGLSDGSVNLWNSQQLACGEPSLQKTVKLYDAPVGGLTQSGFQSNLLASGSVFGQVHLWDLNKIDKQTEMSFIQNRNYDTKITDLAWSAKVPHIVAVSSSIGEVSVLDLRSKKVVINFSLPEAGSSVSSISWNPESPTGLVVSNSSDSSPFLYLWDLKSPTTPQSVFTGHSKGVLSTCWPNSASGLVLSSSRDGSAIAWNANGELVKSIEKRDGAIFAVNACPSDSDNIATCGLDGGIKFFSLEEALQATQENEIKEDVSCANAEQKSESQSQQMESSNQKEQLTPPPVGASFGPGSVCSIFRANRRDVAVVKLISDECKSMADEFSVFENLLATTDAAAICQSFCENESDLQMWKLISLLFSQDFNAQLLEFIGASQHQFPITQDSIPSTIKMGSFEVFSSQDTDIDRSITEKLIAFDVHGAVSICLSEKRFADAMIIASCYGSELKEEVESYILNQSSSSYMRIARALKYHDFSDLIDNAAAADWKHILSLLIRHSYPDQFNQSCMLLAERLSSEPEVFVGAATAFLVAGDLYKFAERLLFGLMKGVCDEHDLKTQFPNVFNAYRFIRLLQFYSYDFLSSITDDLLKNRILDVILRVKYILYLSGSEAAIPDEFSEFSSQFTGKDVNLDLMIEKLFFDNDEATAQVADLTDPSVPYSDPVSSFTAEPDNPSFQSSSNTLQSNLNGPIQSTISGLINPVQSTMAYPLLNAQTFNPSIPATNVNSIQPIQSMLPTQPFIQPSQPIQAMQPAQQFHQPLAQMPLSPQAIRPNPPISPTWSPEGSPKTYNDAPIIKPRGSALVPDISSQVASMNLDALDENQIQNAIQVLIAVADQKSQGVQKKMVSEWGSKLTASGICSRSYDQAAQASIAALFKEINANNWISAGKLVSWLLTTFFSEVKDWILNLKRLLDIASY